MQAADVLAPRVDVNDHVTVQPRDQRPRLGAREGSARYFELGEVGVLDCGQPPEPDTLAEAAAPFCATE